MRGQLADEEEEVYGMLQLIPLALMMVAGVILVGYLLQMQGQLWALQNARMVANTLAGAMTAVATSPDMGVYCVNFPGTYSYLVTVDTAKCGVEGWSDFGELQHVCTGGPGGFVAVWSPDRKESGLSFIPITNVPKKTIRLPKGKGFIVVFTKHTNLETGEDNLDFELGANDFDESNCTWVS